MFLGESFNFLLALLHSAALAHHFLHTQLGIQDLFTQTDGLGGDLDQIVVGDVLNSLFQRHNDGGREQQLFIRAGGTNRGQVLFPQDIQAVFPRGELQGSGKSARQNQLGSTPVRLTKKGDDVSESLITKFEKKALMITKKRLS